MLLLVVAFVVAAFVPLVDCPLSTLESKCVPGYLSVKPHGCSAGKKVSWLRSVQIGRTRWDAWFEHRGVCPTCQNGGAWDPLDCPDCVGDGMFNADYLMLGLDDIDIQFFPMPWTPRNVAFYFRSVKAEMVAGRRVP